MRGPISSPSWKAKTQSAQPGRESELAPGRQRGSVGRAQKAFQKVAQLPRRQQDKIIEIVEAFVAQQERKAS
jgi:hypothetical protein